MPVVSVGDMAQQFISMRNGGTIKTDLARLAENLSTGRVTDITAELGGETTRLSGINYSLAQLDGYEQAGRETGLMLANMQTLLNKVDATRGEAGARLLLLSDSSTGDQIDEAARAAGSAFETMVNTLNTRLADRTLMGGNEVDAPALAAADDMLADMRTALAGSTTVADITAGIDAWFDDPMGGFTTMGYLGDTGPAQQKRVSENKRFDIDIRADDPAIKDVLKAAALAAVASELPGLDDSTKSDLLQESGLRMFSSASGIVAAQSRIGFVEAGVEQALVETAAQRTALEMSKNDLISADPFDTASKLQNVQLQLETHYSVTARLSQLSLLDYI